MTIPAFTMMVATGAASAETRPLPQGSGLAARYPDDSQVTCDPAVIFADDFESYSGPNALTRKWDSAPHRSNVRIASEPGNVYGGAKALEFTVARTSDETGLYVAKVLRPERDIVFVRAYAKYGEEYDVLGSSHNGITIQAHYCCPGTPADGTNKFYVGYEATRFEPSTSAPGLLAAYVYHPLQRTPYGDHFFPSGLVSPFTSTPFQFGSSFVPRPGVIPERGRWYAYELMVKANDPANNDGRIALWLDGRLIADFTNLRLRNTASLKIDKVTLELHVKTNNLAIAKKWYDNVVVATSYIGPMARGTSLARPRPEGCSES